MSISVVIRASTRLDALKSCLESLSKQSRPPDEVIVVASARDHGGPGSGDLARVLAEWQASSQPGPRVKITTPESAGPIAALNKGRESASSTIVCFISEDGVAARDWLAAIEEDFEDPLIGGVGGPVILPAKIDPAVARAASTPNPSCPAGTRNVTASPTCPASTTNVTVSPTGNTAAPPDAIRWGEIAWWGRRVTNWEKVPETSIFVQTLSTANVAFRRHLLRDFDHNLRSERHCAEDICLGLRSMGFFVVCDPRVAVHRSMGIDDKAQPVSVAEAHHDNTYVFLKHSSLPRKIVFMPFTLLAGDGDIPGIFKYLGKILRAPGSGVAGSEMIPALKGKVQAIGTYSRHLSTRSRPYRY